MADMDNILDLFDIENNNDEDFNEVKLDYRGNPLYSSMISKLCGFSLRTEFIISVLQDVLRENENQQIMMLAHNKSILTYLFKASSYMIFNVL